MLHLKVQIAVLTMGLEKSRYLVIILSLNLRSKHFMGFGSKEFPREERRGEGGQRRLPFVPLPHPLFLILALAP